eukprot:888277-Pelagomonas_calceolata.AAC.2
MGVPWGRAPGGMRVIFGLYVCMLWSEIHVGCESHLIYKVASHIWDAIRAGKCMLHLRMRLRWDEIHTSSRFHRQDEAVLGLGSVRCHESSWGKIRGPVPGGACFGCWCPKSMLVMQKSVLRDNFVAPWLRGLAQPPDEKEHAGCVEIRRS